MITRRTTCTNNSSSRRPRGDKPFYETIFFVNLLQRFPRRQKPLLLLIPHAEQLEQLNSRRCPSPFARRAQRIANRGVEPVTPGARRVQRRRRRVRVPTPTHLRRRVPSYFAHLRHENQPIALRHFILRRIEHDADVRYPSARARARHVPTLHARSRERRRRREHARRVLAPARINHGDVYIYLRLRERLGEDHRRERATERVGAPRLGSRRRRRRQRLIAARVNVLAERERGEAHVDVDESSRHVRVGGARGVSRAVHRAGDFRVPELNVGGTGRGADDVEGDDERARLFERAPVGAVRHA